MSPQNQPPEFPEISADTGDDRSSEEESPPANGFANLPDSLENHRERFVGSLKHIPQSFWLTQILTLNRFYSFPSQITHALYTVPLC